MHVFAGICGFFILAVVLADGFNTIVLARRSESVFRITRAFYSATWVPYMALMRRIHNGHRRENVLSIYGPLSLLALLGCWVAGLVVGFGLLQWAAGLRLHGVPATVSYAIYFSGTSLFTVGSSQPENGAARVLMVIEAGLGLSFMGLVVGYLPVLYQSYSSRELRISLMDARAGSPPSAVELLRRSGRTAAKLERQLEQWETWGAEVLQHQLSYPMLAYFRSQHVNQSWLSSLVAIVDASAIVMIASGDDLQHQAQATFAVGRHALVDLARIFCDPPEDHVPDRLPPERFDRLHRALESNETPIESARVTPEGLKRLRDCYEPYALVLSRHFMAALPNWVEEDRGSENWRRTDWDPSMGEFAVSDPFRES